MPEILLNKESFEQLNGRFENVFSAALDASDFACRAERKQQILHLVDMNKSMIAQQSDAIRSIMSIIIDGFTSTDISNRDEAQKISEVYIGSNVFSFVNDTLKSLFSDGNSQLHSEAYNVLSESFEKAGVEYNPLEKHNGERTEQEIINDLSGDDMTEGSCASLAYAYAGAKAGYDVKDFRGGNSQALFSRDLLEDYICSLPGVESKKSSGFNDIKCANELISQMEEGKEYVLSTGVHSTIVRKTEHGYEYLELQSTNDKYKGWHKLDDNALRNRFHCETIWRNMADFELDVLDSYLIEVDSLSDNQEFIDLLGYLNTAEEDQVVGHKGGPK